MESIKKISEYVAQLRRLGPGHGNGAHKFQKMLKKIPIIFGELKGVSSLNFAGVWHFDQMLLHDTAGVAA